MKQRGKTAETSVVLGLVIYFVKKSADFYVKIYLFFKKSIYFATNQEF